MTAQRDRSGTLPSLHEFSSAYSLYADGFLARRSVLSSTLFPEKPAQMWFGYTALGEALGEITAWLESRVAPERLGATLRRIRPPASGLAPACALWFCHFVLLGRRLEGRPWPDDAVTVLRYWRSVYESKMATSLPPGGFPQHDQGFQHLVADESDVAEVVARLDRSAAPHAGPFLAAATNYSWLTEAESRQGVYGHGLYDARDELLLVREFVDLAGSGYAWIDQSQERLPARPIAVALALAGIEGDFDIFGVPRLQPPDYVRHVTGVAVLTEDGFVDDCSRWLQELSARINAAHRRLFRTIATWSARERFIAGARSYFQIWIPVVAAVGGTDADVRRLLLDPLDSAIERSLDEHLTATETPAVWRWVAERGDATVFAPVLEGLA